LVLRGLLGGQDEGLQMTKDEALKLAFDALKEPSEILFWNKQKVAITAIKAALKGHDEPVAWGMPQPDGEILDVISPVEHARLEGGYTVPLYRHQPQRDAQNKPQPTEQAHLLHITIQAAVNIERENCARLCDAYEFPDLAQAIRLRGH